MNAIPTFDQWFQHKTGMTFEAAHQAPGMMYEDSIRALTRETREYITWVASLVVAATTQREIKS